MELGRDSIPTWVQSSPSHSILQHPQRSGKPQEMAGFGGGALEKLPLGYSHWIGTNPQGWNILQLCLTPHSVQPPGLIPA